MITETKILIFMACNLISLNLWANESCQLIDNETKAIVAPSRSYVFAEKTLACWHADTLDSSQGAMQSIDQFYLIRSNINELTGVEVLASSHGYHLVNKKYSCQSDHCQHVSVLPLTEFNPIEKISQPANQSAGQKNSLIENMVNQINASYWKSDAVTLSSWSRQSGSTGNNAAQQWIANKMLSLGLQTNTQEFNLFVSGTLKTTRNIIGVQAGSARVDDWYIIGAHMDSIPTNGSAPGSVDNASGCAGVLELARIASQYSFAGSLLFICFSGEEQGFKGSQFHVNSLINEGNQSKVKAALTMDMIGYTSSGLPKVLLESSVSNQWLIDILAENATIYAPNLSVFTSTNPFGSDHMPYINNNMHGILSIDEDWHEYLDYHKSSDLPENLNLNQGKYILTTNLAAMAELATVINFNQLIFASGFE